MDQFTHIEAEASGTNQVWIHVSVPNAGIHGFFDIAEANRLWLAMDEALKQVAKNREDLEEFNSRRFHPTAHDRIAEYGK
jgi:hypothetical protein